jgi:hypothetical protein
MSRISETLQDSLAFLSGFVGLLNSVHMNVWAILLVTLSVVLYCGGKDAAGLALSTGAFALLQSAEKRST